MQESTQQPTEPSVADVAVVAVVAATDVQSEDSEATGEWHEFTCVECSHVVYARIGTSGMPQDPERPVCSSCRWEMRRRAEQPERLRREAAAAQARKDAGLPVPGVTDFYCADCGNRAGCNVEALIEGAFDLEHPVCNKCRECAEAVLRAAAAEAYRLSRERFWELFDSYLEDGYYRALRESDSVAARLRAIRGEVAGVAVSAGLLQVTEADGSAHELRGLLRQMPAASQLQAALGEKPLLAEFLYLALAETRHREFMELAGPFVSEKEGNEDAVNWDEPATQATGRRLFEEALANSPHCLNDWRESGLTWEAMIQLSDDSTGVPEGALCAVCGEPAEVCPDGMETCYCAEHAFEAANALETEHAPEVHQNGAVAH